MRQLEGTHHRFFIDFIGAAFHHHNGVAAASHAQIEVTIGHFWDGGIDYQLTVD